MSPTRANLVVGRTSAITLYICKPSITTLCISWDWHNRLFPACLQQFCFDIWGSFQDLAYVPPKTRFGSLDTPCSLDRVYSSDVLSGMGSRITRLYNQCWFQIPALHTALFCSYINFCFHSCNYYFLFLFSLSIIFHFILFFISVFIFIFTLPELYFILSFAVS